MTTNANAVENDNLENTLNASKEFEIKANLPYGFLEHTENFHESNQEVIDKSKEALTQLKYNRQKREQKNSTGKRESIEDNLNEMNGRLKEILHLEITNEHIRAQKESNKLLNKVRRFFGLYNSKISEDQILETVIKNQINELGAYSSVLESDAKLIQRGYERKKQLLSTTTRNANQCVDDYQTSMTQLTLLQEQLTENIRSRNEYMQKKSKDPNDKTLDSYIEIAKKTITEIEDQVQNCKDQMDTLENDIKIYENQFHLDKEATEEARTHNYVINAELTDAKKSHDTLVRLMDSQNGRRALVGIYTNILKGRKLMDKSDEISKEARECILSSIEQVRQYQRDIKGNSANQYASILDELRKERAESVQAAIARRYGIQ